MVMKKSSNKPSDESLRLMYAEGMENFRQVMRTAISFALIALAVNGLAVQVIAIGEVSRTIRSLVLVGTIGIQSFEVGIGAILITYSRSQRRVLEAVGHELALPRDETLKRMELASYFCLAGLLLVLLNWVVFLALAE